MFVEIHVLQNFAPANLNRDDTGSPKDCIFGGHRRARVSSQCWKRAARTYMRQHDLVAESNLGERTRLLIKELSRLLIEKDSSRTEEQALKTAIALLQGAGLKVGDDNRTQYLLFLGRNEIAELAGLCHQHWQALAALQPTEPPESGDDKKLKKTTKQQKKEAKEAVPPEIKRKLEQLFNGGKAVDVSLFGRMVADSPGLELDAAAQVAHAVSANAIAAEFDYFTAVDDLQPGEEAGAGMIGTVEFNSACFYRYANVDTGQLDNNLQHDVALARQGLGAFLRAFVLAVPAGKQNSMAAHNPPSFVMTVVRLSGLWSLANAFLKPVTGAATDMVDEAIQRLDAYWNSLTAMYPDGNRVGLCTLHPGCLKALQPHCLDTFEEVVRSTVQSAFPPAG